MPSVISESWDKVLGKEYNQPYLASVQARLKQDLAKGFVVCPPVPAIFNAYKLTPFSEVRVVILGQDPYYSHGAADGLAFSSMYLPPSLETIFAEIKGSTGMLRTETRLNDWAEQGVFLLNTVLTTLQGKALAHANIGWEKFTKYTLQLLNARSKSMVVMLWGSQAIAYESLFDGSRHLVLKAPHPASDGYGNSYRTFRGCQHFSMCNDFLESHGLPSIHWGDPIV